MPITHSALQQEAGWQGSQNRDSLFPTEELAAHCNPLRPLHPHLPSCHPPGRHWPLLVMSPDLRGPSTQTRCGESCQVQHLSNGVLVSLESLMKTGKSGLATLRIPQCGCSAIRACWDPSGIQRCGSSHGEHRHLDFHPIQLEHCPKGDSAGVDDNVEQSGNPRATISHSAPSTDPKSIFPSPLSLSRWWMMMALHRLPCQQWSSALPPTVAAGPPAVDSPSGECAYGLIEGQWDPGWLGNSVDLGPYVSVFKTGQ